MSTDSMTITIRRRPWWQWVLAVLAIGVETVLAQTAWSSILEEEYRAATICCFAFAVLAVAGILGWAHRPRHSHVAASSV